MQKTCHDYACNFTVKNKSLELFGHSNFFTNFANGCGIDLVRLHLYGIIAFDAIVLDSENCQFSTQRGQCTERLLNSHFCTFTEVTFGGLSVLVCCVGMAVPLNRTRLESPPLLYGGGKIKAILHKTI